MSGKTTIPKSPIVNDVNLKIWQIDIKYEIVSFIKVVYEHSETESIT